MMKRFLIPALILTGLAFFSAADAQEELSRQCNAVYRKLCRDIPAGPEMLGQCFAKHPKIADRIPAKCTEDFQTNIENYNDAKSQ